MEKILNDYLEKIERYLKPLPISERVDIVKEIQSEIFELQSNGKNAKEIMERLGNPKELAKAYLGDLIAKDTSFRTGNHSDTCYLRPCIYLMWDCYPNYRCSQVDRLFIEFRYSLCSVHWYFGSK